MKSARLAVARPAPILLSRQALLTTYNNGDYGVYACDAIDGLFEHSWVGGGLAAYLLIVGTAVLRAAG